jgi:hypothetical protein
MWRKTLIRRFDEFHIPNRLTCEGVDHEIEPLVFTTDRLEYMRWFQQSAAQFLVSEVDILPIEL